MERSLLLATDVNVSTDAWWVCSWLPPRYVIAAMSDDPSDTELVRLRGEVELYRQMLELSGQDHLEPLLQEALRLMVQVSGARRGYLELRSRGDGRHPVFWMGHTSSGDDVGAFRESISKTVIERAITTQETIITTSAVDDPRFARQGSVRTNRIEAVLCAPVGREPAIGAVYLQDRQQPGPFRDEDRRLVELLARLLAPLADRLLLRRFNEQDADPTTPFRASLAASVDFVGRSRAVADVLKQVTLVAPHDVGVLLTGPTGTGKTMVARIIHQSGPRAQQPFVELNCAALPDTLIENELFGAAPGAHSTATSASLGKVAAAQHGTLFLDEIGELSLAAQSKLLQLLQSGKYFRLGDATPRVANVRVIAATNVDLEAASQAGTFREDLYYRLNVLPIRLPSLEERPRDIPLLAAKLLEQVCTSNRLPQLSLSPAALYAVETAEWPGNVRQLSNHIAAAALRASGEAVGSVEPRHVFPDREVEPASSGAVTYQQHIQQAKRQIIERTLEETDWNVTEAARRLDVARSLVHKLIRVFELKRG